MMESILGNAEVIVKSGIKITLAVLASTEVRDVTTRTSRKVIKDTKSAISGLAKNLTKKPENTNK